MAKRLTTEQKNALQSYSRAEFGMDNYLGSVFVNELNTKERAIHVERAYNECVKLGLDVGTPSYRWMVGA